MNSSILASADTGTADVHPVISTVRWVIVDSRHRLIVCTRLLYVISPANTKKRGYRFVNDVQVKHLHLKAYVKRSVTLPVKHSLSPHGKAAPRGEYVG